MDAENDASQGALVLNLKEILWVLLGSAAVGSSLPQLETSHCVIEPVEQQLALEFFQEMKFQLVHDLLYLAHVAI